MTICSSLPDLGRRPLIMGILNLTPDSFSGDGLLNTAISPLDFAASMVADGADILDIGGESSRPGSMSINVDEEIRRTIPVIEALHTQFPSTPLSIDTVKPEVAAEAVKAGACIINDISGMRQNPSMLTLAAQSGALLILMHNGSDTNAVDHNARLGTMYEAPPSNDIVSDVRQALSSLAQNAIDVGVDKNRIILDPGLGFGKTVEQNLRLINELDKLKTLGFPLLVGPSRKSFIGRTLDTPVEDRLEGTAATVVVCVMRASSILRVHDVKAMSRIVKMTSAIIGQKA